MQFLNDGVQTVIFLSLENAMPIYFLVPFEINFHSKITKKTTKKLCHSHMHNSWNNRYSGDSPVNHGIPLTKQIGGISYVFPLTVVCPWSRARLNTIVFGHRIKKKKFSRT